MRIFMGLLAICINFSVKCLCVPSHCFCQFVDLLYIFWILIHCANIFSQFWLTLPLFFKSAGTMLKGVTRLVSRVHKLDPGHFLGMATEASQSLAAHLDNQVSFESPRAVSCTSENDPVSC